MSRTSALSEIFVGLGMKWTGFLLLRTCDSLLATCFTSASAMRTMFAKAQHEAGSPVAGSTVGRCGGNGREW